MPASSEIGHGDVPLRKAQKDGVVQLRARSARYSGGRSLSETLEIELQAREKPVPGSSHRRGDSTYVAWFACPQLCFGRLLPPHVSRGWAPCARYIELARGSGKQLFGAAVMAPQECQSQSVYLAFAWGALALTIMDRGPSSPSQVRKTLRARGCAPPGARGGESRGRLYYFSELTRVSRSWKLSKFQLAEILVGRGRRSVWSTAIT